MSRTVPLFRRTMLALIGATAVVPLLPRRCRAQHIGTLAHCGPSITLAHAAATGRFASIAQITKFTAWRSPDELRAGLTSGEIALTVVPIQAAANLYNRGFPIRLANALIDSLLYIIAEDASIASISDLAGRHIAVPFRGDTPEIILGQLLAPHGRDAEADLRITYAGTPTEAMQLMLAGRVDPACQSRRPPRRRGPRRYRADADCHRRSGHGTDRRAAA